MIVGKEDFAKEEEAYISEDGYQYAD